MHIYSLEAGLNVIVYLTRVRPSVTSQISNTDIACHVKGIAHLKNENSVIIYVSFQTCMSFFLMFYTKENILKNAGNQTVDGPH